MSSRILSNLSGGRRKCWGSVAAAPHRLSPILMDQREGQKENEISFKCFLLRKQGVWISIKCSFFFFIIILFIYLAALGLCFCARDFSSCGERGLLFVAVHGLLIAVASLVAEHGL